MGSADYGWKRFWYPRGAAIQLTSHGFLIDPDSDLRYRANKHVEPLATLLTTRCLVLLGEAGIGKSTELRQLEPPLQGEKAVNSLSIDLGEYASPEELSRDLFESEQIQTWKHGHDTMCMLVDGLDEALLETPKIIGVLRRGFDGLPIDRLQLRIACRTAAWPETFTDSLKQLFGCDGVGLYELARLRRVDIAAAASAENTSSEEFLDQLENRGAGPLAANPITLKLLLKLFREHQGLPNSLIDLYERGLSILCDQSQERKDRTKPPQFSASQLLQVASRIGAATMLTRRTAVFKGPEQDACETDVTEAVLAGGHEEVDGSGFKVTPIAVWLTMTETGLFSSRGANRLGFAHKTYGEYLAARYLFHLKSSGPQIRTLLYVPDDNPPRLVPQLHEVAAWLASMDASLFGRIIEVEPEVLLRSDVSSRDATTRARLVDALLTRVDLQELSWSQIRDMRGHLHRLVHEGLAAQLRVFIHDEQRRVETRRLAVEIADAASQRELADELAEMALNEHLDYILRDTAAHAVVNLELPRACEKLKPLALGQAGDDPDDQLRGYGLIGTWPQFLSFDELLQALTPPKRSNFAGTFVLFLISSNFEERIEPINLPKALKWACELPTLDDATHSLSRIAGRLASRALSCLNDAMVKDALVKLVRRRLREHARTIFLPARTDVDEPNDEDEVTKLAPEERRILVAAIVSQFKSPAECFNLFSSNHRFVVQEDIAWCFEQANVTTGHVSQCWARLARLLFSLCEPEHVALWLHYKRTCPAIAEEMPWPEKVELGSPEAIAMKEEYLDLERQRRGIEKHRAPRATLDPSAAERVRIIVDRCLGGEARLFLWLLDQMRLEDDPPHRIALLPDTIHEHPGWKAAHETLRTKIIDAARRYLRGAELDPDDLMQREASYVADRAPSLAVHLLLGVDPAFLNSLDSSRWRLIAPFLLLAPVGTDDLRRKSVELAYPHASETLRGAAMTIIGRFKNELDTRGLTSLENCLDDALAALLLDYLRRDDCHPVMFRHLLGWLLRHNNDEARALAETLLRPPCFCDNMWPRLCREAAIALVTFARDVGWDVVWPHIDASPDFGRAVLRVVAHDFERPSLAAVKRLSDQQLGLLMDWFLKHVPPCADPDYEGAHSMGPDDSLREWRDTLLSHLRGRATTTACEAIRRLCDGHPEYPWLRDVLLEAQQQRRRTSWAPPRPQELLILLREHTQRFVGSAGQLIDVVIESLDRYAEELHGTTPTLPNLWNELPHGKRRPKGEEHLSDNIAQHLRRDLRERRVIVNREVEIRRRQSKTGQPGQKTDIQINAVTRERAPDVAETLTVIVEVKGCWNDEIRTAMKTQLVERYLHDNQCQHGLYVVGWFLCDAWDDEDDRKKRTPWVALNNAKKELAKQAEALRNGYTQVIDVRSLVLDCALR